MASRSAWIVLAVVGIGLASGCERPKGWERREVDHAVVEVDRAHLHLRTDMVGEGRFESPATFVLVDAQNTHTADLEVTLGGVLVDAGGQTVAELRAESLRIPAGGVRTFALIDDQNQARPSAVTARVEVIVLAGFYGADGTPLRRPFTLMELAGNTSHPAEFVGPEGATKAYIFIGQYVY